MLIVAGIALGALLAAAVFFVARGVAAIIYKRWRGAWLVLLGLGLFATYCILLGGAAILFLPADSSPVSDPSNKPRVLAENISTLMNCSALGAPLGLLLGLVFVLRSQRASRAPR